MASKLDTLQRLHNRAHAIIENACIKDEWSSNWLSVENLIRFDRSVMAYKILSKLSPESLWDKYQYRSVYSNYVTRNCKDLQIPRLKIEHAKKGFYYCALKAWNGIPANIREIQTLGRFKKELTAHLTRTKHLKHDPLEERPFFFFNLIFDITRIVLGF